jgi:acyl-CoA synthetase (AMP-forming)/AMP-acid ligase II/acyl carrier protein
MTELSLAAATLVEVLNQRAEQTPDRLLYRFLTDGTPATAQELTYTALRQRAQAIAVLLQELRCQDQPVLLLYPAGLDYIAAFFGCLYAGALAVPAYPPRPNRSLDRIEAIVEDTGATVALTDGDTLEKMERQLLQAPGLKALYCLNTDGLDTSLASAWRPHHPAPDHLALLQYTSGSTAAPKGVMISHGNLLHNSQLISRCFGNTAASRGVSWLPPYHDMGLVGGVLQPLYVGAEMTLMAPVTFLQRPLHWLAAIAHYQATTSGGPNFAYDLCVRKTTAEQRQTLDLSSWQLAFTGAEPIHPDTLHAFASAFAPSGFRLESFYPCYGMAETTLMITGEVLGQAPTHLVLDAAALERNQVVATPGQGVELDPTPPSTSEPPPHPRQVKLVSCGQPAIPDQVWIVDPETHRPCPPDRVGEIWVQPSASLAQGYWRRPTATQETFEAQLAEGKAGPFLRTGDLGFLRGGNLYVTGRLKDLIIIRGRNHYPQDLEATVAGAHPALTSGACAAFALSLEEPALERGEQLVIVQELGRSALRSLDPEAVFAAIRRQVAEQHDVQVGAIALLRPNAIPKTSSGKIQRHRCRADFLAGDLAVVHSWRASQVAVSPPGPIIPEAPAPVAVATTAQPSLAPESQPRLSRQALMAWMVNWLAQTLKQPTTAIDVQRPLAEYGLDSITAVELAEALQSTLGVPLSPTLAYEYPTIAALSTYLSADPVPPLVAASATAAQPLEDGEVEQLLEQLAHLSGVELQALLGTPSIEWN